VILQSLGF
jgi:callose synthase